MSDNVVKFRRIEKQPEPKPPRKPGVPDWVPWVALVAVVAVAIALYLVQRSGLLG